MTFFVSATLIRNDNLRYLYKTRRGKLFTNILCKSYVKINCSNRPFGVIF